MKERISPPPTGETYPIWAWHTWDSKQKRPDMRRYLFLTNVDIMLMEINIPDDPVLLSNADFWQIELNRCYYYESDYASFWDKEDEWYESLPNKEKTCTERVAC